MGTSKEPWLHSEFQACVLCILDLLKEGHIVVLFNPQPGCQSWKDHRRWGWGPVQFHRGSQACSRDGARPADCVEKLLQAWRWRLPQWPDGGLLRGKISTRGSQDMVAQWGAWRI